jgi:hypothetical protein
MATEDREDGAMTDEAWREGFARLHQCMDRLETKLDAVETEFDALKACMRDGFDRIDNTLSRTADTWVVHVSVGGLVLLMTISAFLV